MEHSPSPALTREEKLEIFRIATRSLVHWFGDELKSGMTDEELTAKLQTCLGTFGGSGGPDRPSVTFKGAGLRIWGGRTPVNHIAEKPLFQGAETVAMAREIYGISNPDDDQMKLI